MIVRSHRPSRFAEDEKRRKEAKEEENAAEEDSRMSVVNVKSNDAPKRKNAPTVLDDYLGRDRKKKKKK